MSRQIEFRGKRVDNGEWVYGDLSSMAQRVYISNFQPDNTYKDGAENTHLYKHLWVIPETIGQFTGLTDKTGKKIFEGDILQFIENPKFKEEVSFDDGAFGFYYKRTDSVIAFSDHEHGEDTEEYEVIGNVHDNKELLGENK